MDQVRFFFDIFTVTLSKRLFISATRERILIARFGLSIANRMKTFKEDENVIEILNKIEKFATLNSKYLSCVAC